MLAFDKLYCIDWLSLQEGSRELESELEAQLTQAEIKNKVNKTFISNYCVLAAPRALAQRAHICLGHKHAKRGAAPPVPPPLRAPLFITLSEKGTTMRLWAIG